MQNPAERRRRLRRGGPKQIRPDLTLFERCDEDAVRSARQQAVEIGFAH
jgi:hypothetical protein